MTDNATLQRSPERWAYAITKILNEVLGVEHFPIDVPTTAKEYSAHVFPDDPITRVKGLSLGDFDGALHKAPAGKMGWGIIYNENIRSQGRINFTLGHEFGHYLLHRVRYPEGISCKPDAIVRGDTQYAVIENEANRFAANFLMPLDDYRQQIQPNTKADLEAIIRCANRYDVSLSAALLRWIQYTNRRAVMVLSRDGYILWARSSKRALRTGAYFKVLNRPPISIPSDSIAASPRKSGETVRSREHDAGTWFAAEGCDEQTLVSDHYDFSLTLLTLGQAASGFVLDEEPLDNLFEKIERDVGGYP